MVIDSRTLHELTDSILQHTDLHQHDRAVVISKEICNRLIRPVTILFVNETVMMSDVFASLNK